MVSLTFFFLVLATSCSSYNAYNATDLGSWYETVPGIWYDEDTGITYDTVFGDWHAEGYDGDDRIEEAQSGPTTWVEFRDDESEAWPKTWPTSEIPYAIDTKFNKAGKRLILEAMEEIESVSCLKFRPCKREDKSVLKFNRNQPGCFAQLGYGEFRNIINIGRGCETHGIIIHEIFHSLGFPHQQMASNRDDYILIHWDNIIEEAKANFRKVSSDPPAERQVGYDYRSITHYGRYDFAIDHFKPTISSKDPTVTFFGNNKMSLKDIKKLNVMYGC